MENDPETYAIIGAAMEVHRCLGHAFLENTYQEAMVVELNARGIPFEREKSLPIRYKNVVLPCGYKADFVCFGSVIVELKAMQKLGAVESAQAIHYLSATGLIRALLINFGGASLEYERLVLNYHPRKSA